MNTGDPKKTADEWESVVRGLAEAVAVWRRVSPESTGPLEELCHDAEWNVAYWRHRAAGLDSEAARHEAEGSVGRCTKGKFINYDPEDDEHA